MGDKDLSIRGTTKVMHFRQAQTQMPTIEIVYFDPTHFPTLLSNDTSARVIGNSFGTLTALSYLPRLLTL